MKKLLSLVIVSSLFLVCYSCYYDTEIEHEIPTPPDAIAFADDVLPIFSQCTGCHGGTTSPDLRPTNAYSSLVPEYVVAGDSENSKFYKKLPGVGHPMEVGFTLSLTEISLIKGWIDQGAENN